VTNDYATLVAQVIPVMALALGLEIRSLVGRYTTIRAESEATHDVVAFDILYLILALSIVQVFLAAMENYALEAIAGTSEDSAFNIILSFAVFITFLSPSFEAALRILQAKRPERLKAGLTRVTSVAIILAGLLLVTTVANIIVK